MKILHQEIALREETREVEQAKSQLTEKTHKKRCYSLIDTQEELADRTTELVEQILDLNGGQKKFPLEIEALVGASQSMWEAAALLSEFDTGSQAIAAETEAIERLLRAKRGKGGSGAGGGPGGGSRSGRNTDKSALALLGNSDANREQVVERETLQATGKAGERHPEEFSRGLDQYFEILEKRK
jgi:hypothetical protein